MKTSSSISQWWRALLLGPIAILAVLSIVATGGSSGGGDGFDGGDDGGTDIPPTILSRYNFEIASTLSGPWTLAAGDLLSVTVDFGNTILGVINLDVSGTGELTLLSTVTNAGSTFSVTASSIEEPALNGTVAVTVTTDIVADAFDVPTSGAFEIASPLGTITVDIMSISDVQISLAGFPTTSYTWEEYGDLIFAESALDHERVASLGGGLYEFLFERVYEAADVLDELEEVDLMGQIVEECDTYRVAPPASVESVPGQVTLTQNGPVVYEAEWTDCWADAPFDTLLNGIIQLANYIEEVDENNNLTRIGFAPDAGVDGGILFFDFTIEEAIESGGMFTIDPSSTIIVNGGYSLLFTAP